MKIQIAILAALIVTSSLPLPFRSAAASVSEAYAESVYETSTHTFAYGNAVGEPDGKFADFQDQWAYVTLDLGEGNDAAGDLSMTYQILQFGAFYQVEFMDDSFATLQTSSGTFELYSTELSIPYEGTGAYRYVRITCTGSMLWRLDAIAAALDGEPVTEQEEPSSEPTEPEETAGDPRGILVKLVDDGMASTTVDSAVYVIGADGMRHAFPSETVYRSWFEDYDEILYIDPDNLAGYALGANVTVRPGTWLVKITTDPKVYAVEPGGILRWITSEELAMSIYGSEWNRRVIDVPDTFWGNYTVGEPITTERPPEGTLAVRSTGEVVYLDGEDYYSIGGDVYDAMRFSTDFAVTLSDEKLEAFGSGGSLADDPDIAYPY